MACLHVRCQLARQDRASLSRSPAFCFHRGRGDNADADITKAQSHLGLLRQDLDFEVIELEDKRRHLEAQLEALEGELKGVDVELGAKRRMLWLVAATERQLADQKHVEDLFGLDFSSVEEDTKVRGGDMAM
jgi:hypothetical protein